MNMAHPRATATVYLQVTRLSYLTFNSCLQEIKIAWPSYWILGTNKHKLDSHFKVEVGPIVDIHSHNKVFL